jgi:DNA-binding LacI/PurR family transcriptional regulator
VVQGDLQEATAQQAAGDLMRIADPPTAIVTCNDLATIGTIRGLRELGLRIPADVSVLGFDDVIGGDLMDPPLTVIRQPVFEIGCRAIDLLVHRVRSRGGPITDIALPTTLVVRASTAPPRGEIHEEV